MPKVECPKCSAELNAPTEYKGRTVKCKECGKSFVLRFAGRNTPAHSDNKSTVAFRLSDTSESAAREAVAAGVRQATLKGKQTGEPFSVAVEPWREEIYNRVVKESFNGNRSEFVRVALDTLTRQLGYSLAPPDSPKPK
jgi:hypothetical protein